MGGIKSRGANVIKILYFEIGNSSSPTRRENSRKLSVHLLPCDPSFLGGGEGGIIWKFSFARLVTRRFGHYNARRREKVMKLFEGHRFSIDRWARTIKQRDRSIFRRLGEEQNARSACDGRFEAFGAE